MRLITLAAVAGLALTATACNQAEQSAVKEDVAEVRSDVAADAKADVGDEEHR